METGGYQFAGALRRLGDDKDLFQELAAFFVEDAPKLIAAIHQGLASDSSEEVARAAHSLRGLAANFDAEKIMAVAASIEQMARKAELQPVSAALANLEVEVQTLLRALDVHPTQSAPAVDQE